VMDAESRLLARVLYRAAFGVARRLVVTGRGAPEPHQESDPVQVLGGAEQPVVSEVEPSPPPNLPHQGGGAGSPPLVGGDRGGGGERAGEERGPGGEVAVEGRVEPSPPPSSFDRASAELSRALRMRFPQGGEGRGPGGEVAVEGRVEPWPPPHHPHQGGGG
jgi:hypothetical protein